MQAQVKYESEVKTAVLGDRTITVKNLTPVLSPQEQDKRNREVALVNKNWTRGHEKLDTKVECLKTPSLTEP